MDVLGTEVQNDASDSNDLRRCEAAVWRRVWAGGGGRRGAGLSWKSRWLDVARACSPVIAWRASRWTWRRGLELRLAALQSKVLVVLMRLRRAEGEEVDSFCLRRSRAAKQAAGLVGAWPALAAKRIVAWHAHCLRDNAAQGSWAARALSWRGTEWLRLRRISVGSRSADAGRTRTRAMTNGHVRRRWEIGVEQARRVAEAAA